MWSSNTRFFAEEQASLGRRVVERRETPVADAGAEDREELLGVRRVAGGETGEVEVAARVRSCVGRDALLREKRRAPGL